MTRSLRRPLAAALVLAALALSARALAADGPVKIQGELLKRTKLGLVKAVEEAQKASAGQPISVRLTTEDDGSPVWRVILQRADPKGDVQVNVWVDGVTGKAKVKDVWKDDEEQPKNE